MQAEEEGRGLFVQLEKEGKRDACTFFSTLLALHIYFYIGTFYIVPENMGPCRFEFFCLLMSRIWRVSSIFQYLNFWKWVQVVVWSYGNIYIYRQTGEGMTRDYSPTTCQGFLLILLLRTSLVGKIFRLVCLIKIERLK